MPSKFFRTYHQEFEKKGLLLHHKKLIEQHYDFLKCTIENNVLICRGKLSQPDYRNEYEVEIRCVAGKEPYCKILKPDNIEPDLKIHMYQDHSLCLHYPPDMRWHGLVPIYKFTIPWLVEWVHFYELYLVNGSTWEGRQSPVHFTENDKNISEEVE
jgi:hypothetical protein